MERPATAISGMLVSCGISWPGLKHVASIRAYVISLSLMQQIFQRRGGVVDVFRGDDELPAGFLSVRD